MKITTVFNFKNIKKEILFNENQFVIDYIKDLNLVIVNSKSKQFSGIKALDLLDNNLDLFKTSQIVRYNPELSDINSIFHNGGKYRKLVHALINLYLFDDSTFDIISNSYLTSSPS